MRHSYYFGQVILHKLLTKHSSTYLHTGTIGGWGLVRQSRGGMYQSRMLGEKAEVLPSASLVTTKTIFH
jgi:hypothetical protein